jgi:quinol-cytochrome oxidoreductase complex cytochrome b subunit
MRNPFRSPKFRAALYAAAVAIFALLGVYGIATQEQTSAWLNVVAAATAALALVNVPRPPKDPS